MPSADVHRELLLPTPSKDPPDLAPLVWATSDPFWLEIHREKDGRVRYALGSIGSLELESLLAYLESARPRLSGGAPVECCAATLVPDGVYARAVPVLKHHYLPIVIQPRLDSADLLLRTFASRALRDHEAVLQLLFRSVGGWESTFFSPLYENVARRQHHPVRAAMNARAAEGAYHVELRVHITGPQPEDALAALGVWLSSWTTSGGATWRRWKVVSSKREWAFQAAMADHDLRGFSARKARRNVSGTELMHLLSIPWSNHHPECSYSGAPVGRAGPELVVRPTRSQGSGLEPRLLVGASGPHQVALPRSWNHAAILGRTQSGKSTLALSLALQILCKQPGSTVVLIEPTGTLVAELVSRLPHEIASETVEIDPAHATFAKGEATMVAVPYSLLRPPEGAPTGAASRDRWAEALAGDLLSAIRSAWGEESVGGRAELVLRALVQGLALNPGSNLVDAYHILTSKQALQRFVKTAPPGPLREFLEHHLPRLDYNFTMSSLDKVGKIATNPLLRVALCQRSHPVSFDQLLRHRLLLLNLSKPALGADGANFLGAIYLTQLWAAVQRSGRPDRPIYLVLDEVHNYAVPALADMLSEGAKFGLHVIAVTQYLHRVPPRVRAALLGNIDVWLLFSLGTEDMDDAWKIVNGESHGWLPQDLVDGLRPHEAAMSVSGGLLKLETRPWARPGPQAAELKEVVTASSRRYAQPEDSEASPWLVGQEEVETLLQGLAEGSRTVEDLGKAVQLRPDKFAATLARVEDSADVERDAEDGGVRLTPRGSVHLLALQGRRNEGEDHVETLTDLSMFLRARGIAMTIPEQAAGVLMPDGQFRHQGAVYNVEVECSTVAKAAEQVVRNVRKAREAGNRVLIALPDASGVSRALRVLDGAFPGLRLWPDGVGLVWRDDDGVFHPHRVPGTEVWPFLEDGHGRRDSEEPAETATVALSPLIDETDPLPRLLRGVIQDFLKAGKTQATSREIFTALPPSEQSRRTDEQVGVALAALGLKHQRIRANGVRYRVYDLLSLNSGGSDRPVWTSGGPASWPSENDGSEADQRSPPRWSSDSSSENDGDGPAGPGGPAD